MWDELPKLCLNSRELSIKHPETKSNPPRIRGGGGKGTYVIVRLLLLTSIVSHSLEAAAVTVMSMMTTLMSSRLGGLSTRMNISWKRFGLIHLLYKHK